MPETVLSPPAGNRSRIWAEAIVFWAATALAIRLAVAFRLSDGWVSAIKSVALMYLPIVWMFWTRRDLARYALQIDPLGPSLALFAVVALATLIPFYGAAWLLAPLWHHLGWLASGQFRLTLPEGLASLAAGEVLATALPEEIFYRGYLQTRLDEALPGRLRILGAEVGWALPITSLIFVAGHLAVRPALWELSIFFPSLVFGWMRIRSRSLVAPVLYHALCNLGMLVLQLSFGAHFR